MRKLEFNDLLLSANFSPDGKQILTSTYANGVQSWHTNPETSISNWPSY